MHETPRRSNYNTLRVLTAVLAFSLGKTAIAGLPAEQAPSRPWVNVAFVMPKIAPMAEQVAITENLRAWQKTYEPNLVPAYLAALAASEIDPGVVPGNNATDAFTPDWWRCVITPESSGNFNDTSGGFGIEVQTWNDYGMSGVPGQYSATVQASVALKVYAANGGFGPVAWNNSAHCGKAG